MNRVFLDYPTPYYAQIYELLPTDFAQFNFYVR